MMAGFQQPQIMLVPVQGEAGAQMYPVAAGYTVFLADFEAGMAWLKTTAGNGLPQPMRKFTLKEITPPPAPNPNMVTRAEFDELKAMLAKLVEQTGGKANGQPESATV